MTLGLIRAAGSGGGGGEGGVGTPGKSAYELAVENGFNGTVEQWLASLLGSDGEPGPEGNSAYDVAVANGFVGTVGEWLASLQGLSGDAGAEGAAGADGQSAYEAAVAEGFVGTLEQWLASLHGTNGTAGTNGKTAYELAVDAGFSGNITAWLSSLQGATGAAGVGVPPGGTTGQTLTKTSNLDYATGWTTPSTDGGSSGGGIKWVAEVIKGTATVLGTSPTTISGFSTPMRTSAAGDWCEIVIAAMVQNQVGNAYFSANSWNGNSITGWHGMVAESNKYTGVAQTMWYKLTVDDIWDGKTQFSIRAWADTAGKTISADLRLTVINHGPAATTT